QPTLLANARASMVLATPGTSSRSMWPSENQAASASTICGRFPIIARSTFAMIFLAVALTSIMGAQVLMRQSRRSYANLAISQGTDGRVASAEQLRLAIRGSALLGE